MDIHDFYRSIGADSADPLLRLGGEPMLTKYLSKLLDDQTFSILSQAMENQDTQEAFRAAHTLKGIALNLGLTPLLQSSAPLAELLRGADLIPDQAVPLYDRLALIYADLTDRLTLIDLSRKGE